MKKNPVIVSFLDSPAYGGAEEYLLSNLVFLAKIYPVVLATNNQYVLDHSHNFEPIQLIKAPYRLDIIGNWKGLVKFFWDGPRSLLWLVKLHRRLVAQYSRVVVLTPGFSDRLLFTPVLKLWGDAIIWLEYGPIGQVLTRNFGLPKMVYTIAQHFVDKVITISAYSQNSLLTNSQLTTNQVTVVHPGTPNISDQQLRQLRQRGQAWRTQHGLTNEPLICFVGRLADEKEIEVLLNAFAKLEHPQVHLVIVGDGPSKKRYQQQTQQLNIAQKVIFTGFIPATEKRAILATSQVFVFPSAWELEGFGMTTIEAMMTECAVVTTGFGPQAEIITDHATGLHFKPHNSRHLATQLKLLLHNGRLRQKLAKRARQFAQKKFNQTAMNRAILHIVQSFA